MRNAWNLQLVRIYNKGIQSYKDGIALTDNPYKTGLGNLQRQRRTYWKNGWIKAQEDVK